MESEDNKNLNIDNEEEKNVEMLDNENSEILDDQNELESLYEQNGAINGSPQKFGEQEFKAKIGENGKYNKNHYKEEGEKLKQQQEEQQKAKEEAEKKRKEAQEKKNESGSKEDKKAYKEANKNYKSANKDLKNTKTNLRNNKINDIKSKMYQGMHPMQAAKARAQASAKNLAKNTAKKAGKAAAKVAKKAFGAMIRLLASNPIALLAVGGLIIAVFLIILLLLISSDANVGGSYDGACNFNLTKVTYECGSDYGDKLDLDQFVINATTAYIYNQDDDLKNKIMSSDNTIKALMIIMKTNALVRGGYTAENKQITLKCEDDGYFKDFDVLEDVSHDDEQKLNDLYLVIQEELYIAESFNNTIEELPGELELPLRDDELNKLIETTGNYVNKLDITYNNENSNDSTDDELMYAENIFIGDSKVKELVDNKIVSKENVIYSEDAEWGWFKGVDKTDYYCGEYLKEDNIYACIEGHIKTFHQNNIIMWLGNDQLKENNLVSVSPENINSIKIYKEDLEEYIGEFPETTLNFYIIGAKYVDDTVENHEAINLNITNYNNELKEAVSAQDYTFISYIDINGLDESVDNNEWILNLIESKQDLKNQRKKIYQLGNFCVKYNIVESDAYWWPIGSILQTDVNIYGGEPASIRITSEFGWREINGVDDYHEGIDIGTYGQNYPVIASKSGTVTKINDTCDNEGGYGNTCGGSYGNYVEIDHGDGLKTFYAHLYPDSVTDANIDIGTEVKQGQMIGKVGNSGSSIGAHLHFEVRLNNEKVDPTLYVDKDKPRKKLRFDLASVNSADNENSENNKKSICNALIMSAFSENAVAAVLTNIDNEGDFRTNNLENCYEKDRHGIENCSSNYGYPVSILYGTDFAEDNAYTDGVNNSLKGGEKIYPSKNFIEDKAGYGLIQWTYWSRKEKLYNYAVNNKYDDISSLELQLEFLLSEVKGYKTSYEYLTGDYDADVITKQLCVEYLNPANKESECQERADESFEMLKYVKNGCVEG